MKGLFRRAASLLTVAALLTGITSASYALGDELHAYTVKLSSGATLTTQQLWSNSKSDLRTEHYITYTPNGTLSPMVSYGSSVLSRRTVSGLATDLESSGERVLSGINGDYFVMATGDPLGIVVTDGVLRSSASGHCAIGFLPDGRAVMGWPELTVTANFSGYALTVAGVNKVRTSTGGYYLLSRDFGTTTQNTQAGVDVVLAPVSTNLGESVTASNGQAVTQANQLKIGSRVTCVVEQVLQSTGSVSIPEGKFVMTINSKSNEWLVSVLSELQVGDTMELDITSSAPNTWNHVDSALGALYAIMSNGTVLTGLDDSAAPRTAIGIREDGSVLFYAIDGRQSGLSVGASMTQVANRLKELGCVNAVCLDGGGSTTMVATTPENSSFSVVNSPSEGTQRAVTNALFLVSNLSPSGTPGSIYITPSSRTVLAGSSISCTTSFVDTNWYPVSFSDTLSWSAKYGSVSQSGVYTAPANSCTDEITVTSAGGLTGTATVTVFQTADTIRVTNESTGAAVTSLSLPEKTSVDLRATAAYKKLPLASTDGAFSWSVSPASLGTISSDGVFTSGNSGGNGTIKVTAGGFTTSIALNVAADSHYKLLEDFESSDPKFTGTDTVKISTDSAADQVRYGRQSLRADYSLSEGSAQMAANLPVDPNERYLSVWVYGDNSGNQTSVTVQNTDGNASAVFLTTLNFTGWKQVWVLLPERPALITAFTISGSKQSGSFWLDQVTTSNQNIADTDAPAVTLSVDGSNVRATVSDNSLDAVFSKAQLSLALDGTALDFSFDSASKTLTATLPALGTSLHRVTVTATDNSGNIGRASQTLNGDLAHSSSFLDMDGHWAAPYTDYLNELGIITGENTSAGPQFYPNRSITRGDFALMTARWMGLELESYASVSLPFRDTASIPAWSENAVKAMYALGIMKGSQLTDGVYANAGASITRAEAMTILGRIQVKGYPFAALGSFKDAGSVPGWAASYVGSLVGQGVVSGYNGMLHPGDSVSRGEVAKMLVTIW